ncbi:cytochrome P450 [Aspergillus bertholletiae]|uniref:Cytochrome P450 n=1 Tax=Aspergillus bertholletiae TaxID=1226010 RepID=A0A5N7B4C6_9EURO|nr:cytochrome P450 [Aspergillus bertholletiae]
MIIKQFAFDYTMPGAHMRNFGFEKVLGKELARNFPRVYCAFIQELQSAIDETLGLDTTSWRTLNIYSTMGKIVSRANRRVVLGEPLCRDKEIIYHSQRYTWWFGAMLIFLGQLLPPIFRPIFGIFLVIPLKYHRRVLVRRLRPVFKERLDLLREKEGGSTHSTDEMPPDMITWSTKVALESGKAEAQDPGSLAHQFIESIFPTADTVVTTATNFFSDILSSKSDQAFDDLREEARSMFPPGEPPSLQSIKKLHLADSALRETLRRSPIGIYSLFHEVMPKEGVVTPNGHHLPQGTWISVPSMAIHHDERVYSEPDRYDPYRFTAGTNSTKPKSMLTTMTDEFLGFSLGDHGCPGRIYASYLLKSIIAYTMLNYEFRPLSTRPANRAIGIIYAPPTTAKFSLRRTGAAS